MKPINRSLKRYEADSGVFERQEGNPPMDYFTPFGPVLGRTRIPEVLIESLNTRLDPLLSDHENRQLLLSNEFVNEGGSQSLARVVGETILRYVEKAEGFRISKLQFQAFWVVSQYDSTASPVHFHSGDISGVLYLKVPELAEAAGQDSRTYFDNRQAGYINFINGGKQLFSKSLISFKPEIGDIYVFPGWLLHGAEPFKGTGERRSLAFNAFMLPE